MEWVRCQLPPLFVAGDTVSLSAPLSAVTLLFDRSASPWENRPQSGQALAALDSTWQRGTDDPDSIRAIAASPELLIWCLLAVPAGGQPIGLSELQIRALELRFRLGEADWGSSNNWSSSQRSGDPATSEALSASEEHSHACAFATQGSRNSAALRSERFRIRFLEKLQRLGSQLRQGRVGSESAATTAVDNAFTRWFQSLVWDLPAEVRAHLQAITLGPRVWVELANVFATADFLTFSSNRLRVMVDQGEGFEERLRNEKIASMKQLAYGASHEINNPLANIASRAQMLLQQERDSARREALSKINEQAFRAHEMLADMMLFAHPPKLQPCEVSPRDLVETVVADWVDRADAAGCSIETHFGPIMLSPWYADARQIREALRALIANAIEASNEGGTITISVQQVDSGGEAILEFEVADWGTGFSDEALRFLFDPWYSGREAGRGLGLGLSKVWRIAQLHGGSVVAENRVKDAVTAGASVKMRIPYGEVDST